MSRVKDGTTVIHRSGVKSVQGQIAACACKRLLRPYMETSSSPHGNAIVQFVREQCNLPNLANALVEHGTNIRALAEAAEDGPNMLAEYCHRELGIKVAFGTARKLASKLYEISTSSEVAVPSAVDAICTPALLGSFVLGGARSDSAGGETVSDQRGHSRSRSCTPTPAATTSAAAAAAATAAVTATTAVTATEGFDRAIDHAVADGTAAVREYHRTTLRASDPSGSSGEAVNMLGRGARLSSATSDQTDDNDVSATMRVERHWQAVTCSEKHSNGTAHLAGSLPPPKASLDPVRASTIDARLEGSFSLSRGGDYFQGSDPDGSSSTSVPLNSPASLSFTHNPVPRASITEEICHIIDQRKSQPLNQVRVEAALAGVDESSFVHSERAWLLQLANASSCATAQLHDAPTMTAPKSVAQEATGIPASPLDECDAATNVFDPLSALRQAPALEIRRLARLQALRIECKAAAGDEDFTVASRLKKEISLLQDVGAELQQLSVMQWWQSLATRAKWWTAHEQQQQAVQAASDEHNRVLGTLVSHNQQLAQKIIDQKTAHRAETRRTARVITALQKDLVFARFRTSQRVAKPAIRISGVTGNSAIKVNGVYDPTAIVLRHTPCTVFNKRDCNTTWLCYTAGDCWSVGTVDQLTGAASNAGGGTSRSGKMNIFATTAPKKGVFWKSNFTQLLERVPWRVIVNGHWTDQPDVKAEVYVPPVMLVGATGRLQGVVNGVYMPTEETSGGQIVLSNGRMRLHYCRKTANWLVSNSSSVGRKGCVLCGEPVFESGIPESPASVRTWLHNDTSKSTVCSVLPNAMIVTGACQRQQQTHINGTYVLSTTTYLHHVVYIKMDAGSPEFYLRIARSGHWCVSTVAVDEVTNSNLFWSVGQGCPSPLDVVQWQWVDVDNGSNYVVSSTMCVVSAPS